MISPLQSKSFQKKLVRIQKQKERKQRDKQLKRGADAISPDVIPSVEEQVDHILDRYQQLHKSKQQNLKNQKELLLLESNLPSTVPRLLRNLLLAGVNANTARIPGYPREQFDRILLDPPCSALGLRPRLSHEVTLEELYGYRNYQRQFISVAISLLRVGGFLVYSTCTFYPLENEENVKFILSNFPMELVPIDDEYRFGKKGLSGCGLTEEQCQ